MIKERYTLDSLELAHRVIDLITDVKGESILLLDLQEITTIADYFVICTAGSDRQLKAIVDKIAEEIKRESKMPPLSVEGNASSGWVLVDYGGVVVHVFSQEQRGYYRLEDFWKEAKTVVQIQ